MLVTGAGGFATQLSDVLVSEGLETDLIFFDDIAIEKAENFLGRYAILKSIEQVNQHFKSSKDKRFVLGTGNPLSRRQMYDVFSSINGEAYTLISKKAVIGHQNIAIGNGVSVLPFSVVESNVKIGRGTIVNLNVLITHDCIIGEFCELCPGVRLSGNCLIGDNVFIGTGAIILPSVKIGSNSVIGAGSVVINNIPDNVTAVGNPARILNK